MATSLIPDPPPFSKKIAACLSYGAVSVSITLFNKAVFTVYKFPYPCTVTALQISVSLVYMVILQRLKLFDYGKLSFSKAKQVRARIHCWCCIANPTSRLRNNIAAGSTTGNSVVAVCRLRAFCTSLPERPNVQVKPLNLPGWTKLRRRPEPNRVGHCCCIPELSPQR